MAAIIPIDDSLNKSEELATFFSYLMNENRSVVLPMSIPQILAQKIRPGLSSDVLIASITSRFKEAGIPNGPLVGGATNVMEMFVKIFVEELVDSLQNDMRVDIAVNPGAIVQATGANAGGPVLAVGSVTQPYGGVGVAR